MGNRPNDPIVNSPTIGTPTDSKVLSATPTQSNNTFGIGTANKTGKVMAGTGYVKELNPEFDSFKKRLPGSEGIFAPEEIWQSERAARQTKLEQTGNAVAKTLINIAPEVVKQAANMLDFSGDFESDNAIAAKMTEWQGAVDEQFGIYRKDPSATMDFGDYAYWMEQGSNLVQSAAAFAILGYATAGVGGLALKAGSGLAKAAGVGRGVKGAIQAADMGIAAANAGSKASKVESLINPVKEFISKSATGRNANGLTNAWLMNKAEGVGVGVDTFKNTYEKRVGEIKEANPDMADAEVDTMAKADAAQAAAYAYNFNKMNIALNITSSFAFVKPGIGSFRQSLQKGGAKEALKHTAMEGVQEAGEESINYIAQKRGEAGDAKLGWKGRFEQAVIEGSKDAMSAEGREAAMWGALGGIAQTGFTKAGSFVKMHHNDIYDQAYKNAYSTEQKKAYQSKYDEKYEDNYARQFVRLTEEAEANRDDLGLGSLNEEEIIDRAAEIAAKETHTEALQYSADIAASEASTTAESIAGDKNKWISKNDLLNYQNSVLEAEREKIHAFFGTTDSEGKRKIMEAYDNIDLFNNTADILEIDDQLNTAQANGDAAEIDRLTELKFDTRVVQAMQNGTLNTLEDALKGISALTPAQAVESGLATSEDDIAYKTQAQKGLQSIKDIEKMAYRNRNLLNADNVTGLDINIYRNAERMQKIDQQIKPEINKMLEAKREKLFKQHTHDAYWPHVSTNYFEKSYEARIGEFEDMSREAKFAVDKALKTLQSNTELEDSDFADRDDLKAQSAELARLDAIQKKFLQRRIVLASKQYQDILEKARVAATKQARDEENAKKVAAKKAANDDKERKKLVKQAVNETGKNKDQKPATQTPQTPKGEEPVQTPKGTTKQTTVSPTVITPVADVVTGTVTDGVTTVTVTPGTKTTVKGTVTLLDQEILNLTKLQAKQDINKGDASLYSVYTIITDTLKFISATMESGNMIPLDALREEGSKGPALITMLAGAKDKDTAKMLAAHVDTAMDLVALTVLTFEAALATVNSVQAAAAVESPINSSDTDEDILNDGEPEQAQDVDLDKAMEKRASLAQATNAIKELTNLIDSIAAMGYPTSSYADIESFLIKVLDKEALIKLTPQLARTWDAIMLAGNNPDRMVGEGAYKALGNMTQAEYLAKQARDGFWDDSKEAETEAAVNAMVDTANTVDEVLPTREYSQSIDAPQFKGVSSLNLAYLAKAYTYAVSVAGNFINKVKTDLDGLNENLDTRALDPDYFKVGSEVTLAPLLPGSVHKYIEDGMNVEVTRLADDPSMVEFTYYGIDDKTGKNTGIKKELTERHPALTHLPIFIKKKGNDKYSGMYVHLPSWVNDQNIRGTAEELDNEMNELMALREAVLNNKGKNLVVKVKATSDGIYLTDGEVKSVSEVSEKNTPEIAILNNNFELRSSRDKKHHYDNNIDLTKFNRGATFMLVKNGEKTYAIPVKKKPFGQLEKGEEIADTIVKMVDLFLTKNHTPEQKELAKVFKNELKIDTTKFEEVLPFIKKFLYTDFYKGQDKDGFMSYMNALKESDQSVGTSVFNMNVSEKGKPFLQFGRIGAGSHTTLDSNTITDKNKEDLLASLKNHILDAYLNTNAKYINQTRKMYVLDKDNKPSFIGESYKDFLRDNTFTTIKPTTITVGNKEKEIYTIQKTIQIESPVVPVKIDNSLSAAKEPIVTDVVTPAVAVVEDEVVDKFADMLDDIIPESPINSSDTDEDINAEEDETDESLLEQEVDDEAIVFTPEVETVSLLDKYDFIPDLDSKTTQAILDDAYAYIVNHVITSQGAMNLNEALEQTFAKIDAHFGGLRASRAKIAAMSALTDIEKSQQEQALYTMDNRIAARKGLYDIVIANKEKLKAKVLQRVKQEGIFQKGTAQEVAAYKKEIKRKKDLETQAKIDAAIELGADITGELDRSSDTELREEEAEVNEDGYPELDELGAEAETEDENGWNTENIYKNSFKGLDKQVRDFFRGINNVVTNAKGKPTNAVTLLGLPEFVETMDAYLTVQHILANYPNQTRKEPNFENYVALIEKEVPKRLFLQNVVDRLRDPNLPESFKIAFVKSMNKQYNNLIMADIRKGGATKIIKLDSANALKLSLNKWEANFNNSGKYRLNTDASDNAIKSISPELLRDIKYEYDKVMSYINSPAGPAKDAKKANVLLSMKAVYESLGIELHPNFYKDLQTVGVSMDGSTMTIERLAISPMFQTAIANIIGDKGKGIPPNINLYTTPLFQNYGFHRLAKLNAQYEEKLYGNSAKDVSNNTVASFSEMKNIMDSFLKNRDGEAYVISTFADPYRDVRKQLDDTSKSKTWMEHLLNRKGDGFALNRGTLFSDNFEHFMWNGASFYSEKGKNRVPIDKMTDYGLLKMHLNAFLNEGTTQDRDGEAVHIGYLPFFTMSDKKIPSAFKVPMERFEIEIFVESEMEYLRQQAENGTQEDIDRLEKSIAQRKMIFNSMVKPELNRIIALSKEGEVERINIEGYERKNLKFYQSAYLNTIDFDYIDGDRKKGLDTTGELRKRLGLETDAVFSMEDTTKGNEGGRVLNAAVLEKDSVQQFMLEKTIEHLTIKYAEKTQELVDKGLIVRDQKDPNRTFFVNDKGIDLEAVRKYSGQKKVLGVPRVEATDTILNFVANTAIGYANMQQLLVTDPIQFAKTGDSDKIRLAIQELIAEETAIELRTTDNKGVMTQEDALRVDEIAKEKTELQQDYLHAWAIVDARNTYDNQAKRLAADNASGAQILPVDGKDTFDLLVLKDFEVTSDFVDEYRRIFKKAGYSDAEVETLVKGYKKINAADAQEMTTLEEHLNVMVGRALISATDAAAILKSDNEGKLSVKDYDQILTSMKLVYGHTFMDDNGINRRVYVKSSTFPLSKTFTKGLPIDNLRQFLVDNNIGRVTFESAVKVGAPKEKPQIFGEDGSVNTDAIDVAKHVIRNMPRAGHKNQTDMPYDEDKQVKRDSTQQSKMQFNNMLEIPGFIDPNTGEKVTGRKLQSDYNDVVNDYYKQKFYKLRDRIFDKGEINFERLHEILMEAAESRNYSQNAKAFFDLNEDKTGFVFPLWLSENTDKIEALLNSIVDNNVRIRKRRGFSKVLVSDSILGINQATKSNIVLIDKNRGDKLRPMRLDPVTKKMLPAEIVVTFPLRDNYGNLLNVNDYVVDGQIDMSRIPQEILEGVGVRIPYQGINSSSNVTIVGFLPADVDGVAFGPKDWVNQMGSDFDADKLYVDIYNTIYDKDTDSFRKISKDDIAKVNYQKSYLKEKGKLDKLQELNDKIRDKPEDAALYKKNVKEINRSIAKLQGMLDGKTQSQFLSDFYNTSSILEKSLENKMTDYSMAILANPHPKVQAQRVMSIDSIVLEELKDKIVHEVFVTEVDKHWTPNDHSFQIEKYMGARGGKTGVSGFSSDAVLNSLLQGIKSGVDFLNYDGRNTYPATFNLYGKKNNKLNNHKSIDGTYKSDIIQALQSIAVDNERVLLMDKLNINDYTSDFIRAAIQLGYNTKDIFYLINHPVIKEYVKSRNNETSFETPVNYIEEKGKKTYRLSADYNAGQKELSHEQMKADIEKGVYDPKDRNHDTIFKVFQDISARGKQLKQLGSLLNIDSSGLGTNLLFALNKEKAVDDLKGNKVISNVGSMLSHDRPEFDDAEGFKLLARSKDNSKEDMEIYLETKKKYEAEVVAAGYTKKQGGGWAKNTSIPGSVIKYALKFNNQMWRKLFPYDNYKFEDIRGELLSLHKDKDNDIFLNDPRNEALLMKVKDRKDEFQRKAINRDKVVSTSPKADAEIESKAIKSYRAFLFSSVGDLTGESASSIRRRLIHNNSLAHTIQLIKAHNLLPNNKLIGKLTLETIEKDGFEPRVNIIFDASTGDSFEEDRLLQDMISMIESKQVLQISPEDSISVAQLAKDLILHQMVTSGVQKANQFIKHIPHYHLLNMGLFNNMQKIVDEHDNKFIEQYIQHNPEAVYSDALNKELRNTSGMFNEKSGVLKLKSDNLEYLRQAAPSSDTYSQYVSLKDEDGNYRLYKRSTYNPDVYLAISLLGVGTMTEYDATAKGTIRSGFESNQPRYDWVTQAQKFEQTLEKGYEPGDVVGEMQRLQKEGLQDKGGNDPNKIYKICP